METTDKVRLSLEFPKDLHHKLKVKAVTEGTTMSALILQFARDYVNAPADRTTDQNEPYRTGGE